MNETVFDKVRDAHLTNRGLILSASEAWLLFEVASEGIDKAGADYVRWQETFQEYEQRKLIDDKAPPPIE